MFLFGDVFLIGKELDYFWIEYGGLLTSDIRDCLEIWLDDASFLRV